jgi:uncharacterized membrane protein
MSVFAALVLIHVLAAAYWVGGMATVHMAVRPAAVEALVEPPRRLALMHAVLGRFFFGVTIAVAALLASGFVMIALAGGFAALAPRVHAMTGVGLLMAAIFGVIRLRFFAQMRRAVAQGDWPAAAAALGRIRPLVALNLVLGVLVFAITLLGRAM